MIRILWNDIFLYLQYIQKNMKNIELHTQSLIRFNLEIFNYNDPHNGTNTNGHSHSHNETYVLFPKQCHAIIKDVKFLNL